MFEENFEKKYSHLPESVKAAGPHAQVHADAVIAATACWDFATSVASTTQNHHKGDRHLCGGFTRADDSGYNTPDISLPSPDGGSVSALVAAP